MAAIAKAPARPARAGRGVRTRDGWWAGLFLAPQVAFLLVFLVVPLGYAVYLSLVQWDGFGPKTFVGLGNFTAQLTDADFLRAVWNTAKLALITVPVGLVLAVLIAAGLAGIKGSGFYRVLYFMPVVTSSVAVALIWQVILADDDNGVLNSTLRRLGLDGPDWLGDPGWVIVAIAIVTIWSSLGLNVVIFLAGLQTIPPQIVEAARIDGASSARIFRSITLPMLSPTIFFSTVVAVISSFQAFDQIYVLVNPAHNEGARTIVYQVYKLGFKDFQFGMSSAAALILLVLTLLVTLVQFAAQKRFVHYDS
ncbi:sugar ABC transporter permease [Sphaerisporangium krabiense]|uniref:Multiple sugar transport system permease protein n=1 Tax=Sphaerisporangium krabiense TaxID=763782 RepID=A0A7W9DUM0_9ACTN|nr:sugar ABC transporter permease [Sphaerisporangium krabiense]MBB5630535.1 multiple sugar transport system permease protein [Sphaerisporangium krabiense]GII62510.1 sugar ABC transporter permease [Sphaerisporangium krabiense]